MATLVRFWSFLGIELGMANLGLIDFKLGLYIKVNVNNGQKHLKFISQKIWSKWHKIGQMPLLGKNIKLA